MGMSGGCCTPRCDEGHRIPWTPHSIDSGKPPPPMCPEEGLGKSREEEERKMGGATEGLKASEAREGKGAKGGRKEGGMEQEVLELGSSSRWMQLKSPANRQKGAAVCGQLGTLPSALKGPGRDGSTHPPLDTTSFTFTL